MSFRGGVREWVCRGDGDMVVMNTRSGTQGPTLYLRCMIEALQRALRYSYWVIISFVYVSTPAISEAVVRYGKWG